MSVYSPHIMSTARVPLSYKLQRRTSLVLRRSTPYRWMASRRRATSAGTSRFDSSKSACTTHHLQSNAPNLFVRKPPPKSVSAGTSHFDSSNPVASTVANAMLTTAGPDTGLLPNSHVLHAVRSPV